MSKYHFIDETGGFRLEQPENYSYLYFPIAGEQGIKSAVTPNLGGDAKLDQNTFLLEPVSSENLHNNRSTRNFWCHMKGLGSWSVTGASAEEESRKFTDCQDESELNAGLMWHTVTRNSEKYQLSAKVTSFVPVNAKEESPPHSCSAGKIEIMQVSILNQAKIQVTFTPTAALPLYGRSADNIRDHRHVTSLLHRIQVTEHGVLVKPTLSFDERGHQRNEVTYFVCGITGEGKPPEAFYPETERFIGEGGSFTRPLAVLQDLPGVPAGTLLGGKEALGGIRFAEVTLNPGESASFTIILGAAKEPELKESPPHLCSAGINRMIQEFSDKQKVDDALAQTKAYWQEKVNVHYHTGDDNFDNYMHWVSFQPILRRIYGCSFLPHHDYGKGGRGWRDLWQDCLALLIMNPSGVRQMLLDNFGGVRMDGTNATIIGEKQGEFVADRNHITRVWMDHGVWPFYTTRLYIDQTGDIELLNQKVPYFKDTQVGRGTAVDHNWNDQYGKLQKDSDGKVHYGSVCEHLLLQNLCAFYEVGEHNHMRLRGADWNDALDMAEKRGESVAFTNAYAGNLRDLADYVEQLASRTGTMQIELAEEMQILLMDDQALYEDINAKTTLLQAYGKSCEHNISGRTVSVSAAEITSSLRNKSKWLMEHIRKTEWVTDERGNGWFNGYYDNNGRQVEGEHEKGVRMMLTGQVFSIMAGTASKEQIASITKSADTYLYAGGVGGYRLNTDFGEVKTDLGRMFGFAYGEKENGAVFSHMAVMYANALYRRGFAAEGYKALQSLYEAAVNFETSKIYPGIPEYFNAEGRGLYHYLTGAASWYMLTVITEVFGVHGEIGDLCVEPKLMPHQYDETGCACLELNFAGKAFRITIENVNRTEYGNYKIAKAILDHEGITQTDEMKLRIKKETVDALADSVVHEILLTLE